MELVFENCVKYKEGTFLPAAGRKKAAGEDRLFRFSDCCIFPAFCDVHVHLREPGFFYKESMETGTAAAARGGYTELCAMPNLKPVPDCLSALSSELAAIERGARVAVHPYGAITRGQRGEELADIEELSPYVIGYSDDGRGVQDAGLMREAMERVRGTGRLIAAHCEEESLLSGGVIHAGEYAREHGLPGISSESEWRQIERDIRLAADTGCKYHVCHVSAKESVQLIRDAKRAGVDISCETAPHYLILDDGALSDDGRFRMNPPIRGREDREALLLGLCDGTVDMIATDHAPHSAEEKAGGLARSRMGVTGLETAFPALYTALVKGGVLSLSRLVELMAVAPRRRFDLPDTGDICVFDLNREYSIDPGEFLSKGRSTPFEGMRVSGRCLLTLRGDSAVFAEEQ